MQVLNAPPRQAFTLSQVLFALAQSGEVSYDCGLELLDPALNTLGDVSGAIIRSDAAPTITHDSTATIQNDLTVTLEPSRVTVDRQDGNGANLWNVQWGYDRVKPYMLVKHPTVGTLRFNTGVYLLTTNPASLDDAVTAPRYAATGFGLMVLLAQEIGRSYFVSAGQNVLAAVRTAITTALTGALAPVFTTSGITGTDTYGSTYGTTYGGSTTVSNVSTVAPAVLVNLDGSKSAATFSADRSWVLSSGASPTWIQVINDMLKTVAYQPMWEDENGYFRSGPNVAAAKRPVELTLGLGGSLDVGNPIVGAGATRTGEAFLQPNRWVFIQNGLDYIPVEAGGKVTITDWSSATGVNAVGRIITSVQYLDAASQADLQAQGLTLAKAAVSAAETYTFTTAPLPCAGQFDVLGFYNPAVPADPIGVTGYRKLEAQSWTLALDGSDDMHWVANTTPDPGNLKVGL